MATDPSLQRIMDLAEAYASARVALSRVMGEVWDACPDFPPDLLDSWRQTGMEYERTRAHLLGYCEATLAARES